MTIYEVRKLEFNDQDKEALCESKFFMNKEDADKTFDIFVDEVIEYLVKYGDPFDGSDIDEDELRSCVNNITKDFEFTDDGYDQIKINVMKREVK